MSKEAEKMINEYGNQAYWRAVEFTVAANFVGDEAGAKLYADAGIELMQAGYHKFPKESP